MRHWYQYLSRISEKTPERPDTKLKPTKDSTNLSTARLVRVGEKSTDGLTVSAWYFWLGY